MANETLQAIMEGCLALPPVADFVLGRYVHCPAGLQMVLGWHQLLSFG